MCNVSLCELERLTGMFRDTVSIISCAQLSIELEKILSKIMSSEQTGFIPVSKKKYTSCI